MAKDARQKALREMVAPLIKQTAEAKKKSQQTKGEAKEPELDGAVNEFTAQHGDYRRHLRFTQNRGGTAIARWKAAGYLSESQEAGILHCQNLWARLREANVVANLNGNGGSGKRGLEAWTEHQIDSLVELGRIAADFPPVYWDVFENVCRHDLPAGVAGSRLSNVRKSAEISARQVVCFIADLIAMRERLSY